MSADDVEFAERSAHYLLEQGVARSKIPAVLHQELDLPTDVAEELAETA